MVIIEYRLLQLLDSIDPDALQHSLLNIPGRSKSPLLTYPYLV